VKRTGRLRADPAKTKAWQERSRKRAKKKAKKAPARKTRIKPVNHKRIKRLRAMQFGTDGKREWTLAQASCVTGRWGYDGDPMTPSHVLGTRATGAGPEGIVPMLASENTDWDSLDEAKWLEKYGSSKTWVRQHAELAHQAWLGLPEDERAEWAARAKEAA
jgi:hypothetical protein